MLLDVIGTILYIFVVRQVEKRIDTSSPLAIGRAMLLVTALTILSLLSFALSPILILAVISMIVVGLLRGISGPLRTTWINQKLDSRVRATIHSMFGQVDAIGQTVGGPLIGGVANWYTVRIAVSFASLLLAPALLFIRRANRIPVPAVDPNETVPEPTI
jgi:MFS family permease